jgi:hypothetical protein
MNHITKCLLHCQHSVIIATSLILMALVMSSLLPTITEPTGQPNPCNKILLFSNKIRNINCISFDYENIYIRVSISHPFFCFAKHETKRNKQIVSRNFACFAKQKTSEISFCFVRSKISFSFVYFFWFRCVTPIYLWYLSYI